MRVTVQVIGADRVMRALRRAAREIGDLSGPTRAASRAVERTAVRLAPRRTGRLARSIRTSVAGGSGVISDRVRYASFVEYGTRNMRAQPFLRPALYTARVVEQYEQHADDAVRGL